MAANVVAPPLAVARGAGAAGGGVGGGKHDGKGMFLAAIQELEVDAAESSPSNPNPASSSSTFNKVVIVNREDSVSYSGMLLVMVNQHYHLNRLVSRFASTSFNPTIFSLLALVLTVLSRLQMPLFRILALT